VKLRSFDDWYEYASNQEQWGGFDEKRRCHEAFCHGFLHGDREAQGIARRDQMEKDCKVLCDLADKNPIISTVVCLKWACDEIRKAFEKGGKNASEG